MGSCKPALSERKTHSMENTPLRDYDYTWNKRRNGRDDGMRLDILTQRLGRWTVTAATTTTASSRRLFKF